MSKVAEIVRAQQRLRGEYLRKHNGAGLVANARARLARCVAAGDKRGADYNRRMIERYERLMGLPAPSVADRAWAPRPIPLGQSPY